MAEGYPFIPETITVHLGRPEENAPNVTVPFLDYVANVASSEIYPTWPEAALRANILAQVSFVLNRVYTEFYRARGYDFDITSSTAVDQYFVNGREIFENVRELAGELFNDYIVRNGNVEPLLASYCDGQVTLCEGLSQWGSVMLAEEGKTPLEILRYYYGDDVRVVENAPTGTIEDSSPETPLSVGDVGEKVRLVQIRLNRISANYPNIPKIPEPNGYFGESTEDAVREFQETFSLLTDGVVGKSTWYYILRVYNAVKRLNELDSEGISPEEISEDPMRLLRQGDTGDSVRLLQYYLAVLSDFYETIPQVEIDGVFGERTRAAVTDAQNTFGLAADGIVGEQTWQALYDAYLGIVSSLPREFEEGKVLPYPGYVLRRGTDSDDVRILQQYLNYIAETYKEIPQVSTTGYFGDRTRESVIAFQELAGLPLTGNVNAVTWKALTDTLLDLFPSETLAEGQYPGYPVGG